MLKANINFNTSDPKAAKEMLTYHRRGKAIAITYFLVGCFGTLLATRYDGVNKFLDKHLPRVRRVEPDTPADTQEK